MFQHSLRNEAASSFHHRLPLAKLQTKTQCFSLRQDSGLVVLEPRPTFPVRGLVFVAAGDIYLKWRCEVSIKSTGCQVQSSPQKNYHK